MSTSSTKYLIKSFRWILTVATEIGVKVGVCVDHSDGARSFVVQFFVPRYSNNLNMRMTNMKLTIYVVHHASRQIMLIGNILLVLS